jgi:hypothetical protein
MTQQVGSGELSEEFIDASHGDQLYAARAQFVETVERFWSWLRSIWRRRSFGFAARRRRTLDPTTLAKWADQALTIFLAAPGATVSHSSPGCARWMARVDAAGVTR